MEQPFIDIAADNTSGATELIHRLLVLCESYLIGDKLDDLREGLDFLQGTQLGLPSFHAVLHLLRAEFLMKLQEGEENTQAIGYISSLQRILDHSGEAIAQFFSKKFTTPQKILTASRSSTVLTALKSLYDEQLLDHLYVMESRPLSEGVKTLRDCAHHNVPSTLLVDAAMGEALSHVDCAIVGADCITADGFLLNKTGTFPMAVCAKALDVPFYVLCDSLKFSSRLRKDVLVENMAPSEVIAKKKGDTFSVWNKYFEWTPIELVREFVTERGIFTPDQLSMLVTE